MIPTAPPQPRAVSARAQREAGRAARARTPRRSLATLTTTGRDPLGILAEQNATRVPELVPLRAERMAASPFAFYRGTAALMAADLARDAGTGLTVASCGDAHIANFGLFASPQRTLLFDLNDFDEAAWAPWEWDVKRLVTSVVVGGQATSRDDHVVRAAASAAVRGYVSGLSAALQRTPLERYYEHFDATGALDTYTKNVRRATERAIRDAQKRTGARAVRRLTERDEDGQVRFRESPPTMTHPTEDVRARERDAYEQYLASAHVDIRLLLWQYRHVDLVRRVVGVGSVGTRCFLSALVSGDDDVLILQSKQAGPSVLVQYGHCPQPPALVESLATGGDGERVVSLQRILQAYSDPFLGHLRTDIGDFYVRQFHDMKGGFDAESLEDDGFLRYAQVCGVTLARAHSQSPNAATVAGYIGSGASVTDALVAWSYAYADVSRADHEAFVASL